MKFEIKKIGPAEAQKMLEAMSANRPVSQRTVERYAHDMRQKNWRRTGQGIAFDKTGQLIDGQHRLWAVIESNTTQEFVVVTGLDEDAKWSIDVGRPRTAGHILHMQGMPSSNRTIAVARTIDALEYGSEARQLSVDDFRHIMDRHEGIEWIIEKHAGHKGPHFTAGVLAAFAILREKYPGKATELWDSWASGANLAANDPFLTVRAYLAIHGSGRGKRALTVPTCRRVLTAITYRLKGLPLAKSYDGEEGLKFFFKRNRQAA